MWFSVLELHADATSQLEQGCGEADTPALAGRALGNLFVICLFFSL